MSMDHEGTCCGGKGFAGLQPASQAEYLAALAQEARLLEFSLQSDDSESARIGDSLQRALERAMDADDPDEVHGARTELEDALTGARDAGLQLSVHLGEVAVDGVVGTMKMGVLSTVLAPAAPVAA